MAGLPQRKSCARIICDGGSLFRLNLTQKQVFRMKLILDVMNIYARIDQDVAVFQLKTGLRCPPGCGSCCSSKNIQVTVVEMLPAAHEILYRDEAAHYIQLIENGLEGCVFYKENCAPAPGHCDMYAARPAVCRLFGFSAARDRLGAPKLAACRHLKQTDPGAVLRACEHQDSAPCFTHFETPLAALDVQNRRLLPVNQALYHAIMRLGLYLQIHHNETLGRSSAT